MKRNCGNCGRPMFERCIHCHPRVIGAWAGNAVRLDDNYQPRFSLFDEMAGEDPHTRNWRKDESQKVAPEAVAKREPRMRGQMTNEEREAFHTSLNELVRGTELTRDLVAHRIKVKLGTLGAWMVGSHAPRPEAAARVLAALQGLQPVKQSA